MKLQHRSANLSAWPVGTQSIVQPANQSLKLSTKLVQSSDTVQPVRQLGQWLSINQPASQSVSDPQPAKMRCSKTVLLLCQLGQPSWINQPVSQPINLEHRSVSLSTLSARSLRLYESISQPTSLRSSITVRLIRHRGQSHSINHPASQSICALSIQSFRTQAISQSTVRQVGATVNHSIAHWNDWVVFIHSVNQMNQLVRTIQWVNRSVSI